MKEKEAQNRATIVKSDLNIEKWPIFGTRSEDEMSERVFVREYVDKETGEKVVAQVTVGHSVVGDELCGPFHTFDYKVMEVLLHIWAQDGMPTDRETKFSLRQVASSLKIAQGGNNMRLIKASLARLQGTPIEWKNSYSVRSKKDGRPATIRYITKFRILDALSYATVTIGQKESELSYSFRFNSLILQNIIGLYSKPVILGTIVDLKKDVSIMLYRHLDLMLAKHALYSRHLDALLDDIGIDNSSYPYMSHKRSLIEGALKELRGKPVSTGYIESADIATSETRPKCLKLVVKKGETALIPTKPIEQKDAGRAAKDVIRARLDMESSIKWYAKSLANPDETRENIIVYPIHKWTVEFKKLNGREPTADEVGAKRNKMLDDLPKTESDWQKYWFGRLLFEEEYEIIMAFIKNEKAQPQLRLNLD